MSIFYKTFLSNSFVTINKLVKYVGVLYIHILFVRAIRTTKPQSDNSSIISYIKGIYYGNNIIHRKHLMS